MPSYASRQFRGGELRQRQRISGGEDDIAGVREADAGIARDLPGESRKTVPHQSPALASTHVSMSATRKPAQRRIR